jgi:hypothetical protein
MWERGLWGLGKQWTEKSKQNFCSEIVWQALEYYPLINVMRQAYCVTRIAAMHIIFTRIGCTLFTCDMYMWRLRHINDSVLSSLKMEGIRLLIYLFIYFKSIQNGLSSVVGMVTGPINHSLIPVRGQISLYFLQHSYRFWGLFNRLFNGYKEAFPLV